MEVEPPECGLEVKPPKCGLPGTQWMSYPLRYPFSFTYGRLLPGRRGEQFLELRLAAQRRQVVVLLHVLEVTVAGGDGLLQAGDREVDQLLALRLLGLGGGCFVFDRERRAQAVGARGI